MPELIDRNELLRRIYERFGQYSTKVIATVEEGKIIVRIEAQTCEEV